MTRLLSASIIVVILGGCGTFTQTPGLRGGNAETFIRKLDAGQIESGTVQAINGVVVAASPRVVTLAPDIYSWDTVTVQFPFDQKVLIKGTSANILFITRERGVLSSLLGPTVDGLAIGPSYANESGPKSWLQRDEAIAQAWLAGDWESVVHLLSEHPEFADRRRRRAEKLAQ